MASQRTGSNQHPTLASNAVMCISPARGWFRLSYHVDEQRGNEEDKGTVWRVPTVPGMVHAAFLPPTPFLLL
jgi:hypothetical protein